MTNTQVLTPGVCSQDFILNLKALSSDDPEPLKRVGELIERINSRDVVDSQPVFGEEEYIEEFAPEVTQFLRQHTQLLLRAPMWKGASFQEISEHLQRLVFSKIYHHVFAPTKSHRERDDALSDKISKLNLVLSPVENLGALFLKKNIKKYD
jgi:hypothetical protein